VQRCDSMANMKLLLVLATVFLCGVTTVVRCDDEEEQEQEEQELYKEDEEDEGDVKDEGDETADPGQVVTYSYSSKPVVTSYTYSSKPVVTSHVVTSSVVHHHSSSSSHVVSSSSKCVPSGFTSLGCWKDTGNRAIPDMDSALGGNYKLRKDAINKCYRLAVSKGLTVFGVQDGGWCAAGKSVADAQKYGEATNCMHGKGGGWANDVYQVKCGSGGVGARYVSEGCWKDTGNRAIPDMDSVLGGNYKLRKDAINKCFRLALSKGRTVFGVQDGGWCAAGNSLASARKYGEATNCMNGKGGGWANNVYRIIRG